MRVVYVTNKLVNGGGERVLLSFISTVIDNSGVVTILFLGKKKNINKDVKRELEAAGGRVVCIDQLFLVISSLLSATIVHLYSLNVYVKLLPFLFFLRSRRKIICHVHGVADSAHCLSRYLFRKSWNPCHEVVFVSESGRSSYNMSKGIVLPNPVIYPPKKENASDFSGAIRMLSVNRLVPVKRIEAQIDLLDQLINEFNVDVTLDIVGEGSELDRLVNYSLSKCLKSRVNFLGGIPHKEVIGLYNTYDVFISTSAAEGLGLSLIEALISGLPAICSSIAAYKEIESIGEGVVLIDPENLGLFSNTVFDYISNGKFKSANIEALEQRFGIKSFQNNVLDMYKLVI